VKKFGPYNYRLQNSSTLATFLAADDQAYIADFMAKVTVFRRVPPGAPQQRFTGEHAQQLKMALCRIVNTGEDYPQSRNANRRGIPRGCAGAAAAGSM